MHLFIKFSKKKHLKSLQNGVIHMKNFKAYIDWEKEHGQKGIGDVYEATNIMNNVNMELIDPETKIPLMKINSERVRMTLDQLIYKPVFCLTGIGDSSLEVVNEGKDYYEVKLRYTEKEKAKILGEFGDHALLISPYEFINQMRKKFDKEKYTCKGNIVKYDDFNVNNKQRLDDFFSLSPELYFWKDKELQYQKEYRFVILNKDIQSPLNIDIGSMNGFTTLMTTEELFNRDFTLRYSKR